MPRGVLGVPLKLPRWPWCVLLCPWFGLCAPNPFCDGDCSPSLNWLWVAPKLPLLGLSLLGLPLLPPLRFLPLFPACSFPWDEDRLRFPFSCGPGGSPSVWFFTFFLPQPLRWLYKAASSREPM